MVNRQADNRLRPGRDAGRNPAPVTDWGAPARQSGDKVAHILQQASYFSVFAVPDPSEQSVGVPLIPFIPPLIYEVKITEQPRRLHVTASPPTPECGFQIGMEISRQPVARQHLIMRPVPNNYESGPGRTPPPTILLPFLSQRFWMYDGHFEFLDGRGSGFRAIAGGRFFPATVAGVEGLRIGGVAEITQGLGHLQGMVGNLAINGFTVPPAQFANQFVFRFVDTEGRLRAEAPFPPIDRIVPNPAAGNAFIPLLAELHPDHPPVIRPAGGSLKRVRLVERLRLADSSFYVAPGVLLSHTAAGPVVGERWTTLVFDPDDPRDTIPLYSTDSVFHFFTGGGRPVGSLRANLFEGRAFRTSLPQLERPFFRLVGFGPLQEGTGQFKDAVGLMTVNGALSLAPAAVSSMYMIRVSDPLDIFGTLPP